MVPNTVLILLQWSRLQCPVSGWGHGPGSSRPQHCTAQLSILEAVLRSPVAETSAVVASTSLSPLLSWPWLSHLLTLQQPSCVCVRCYNVSNMWEKWVNIIPDHHHQTSLSCLCVSVLAPGSVAAGNIVSGALHSPTHNPSTHPQQHFNKWGWGKKNIREDFENLNYLWVERISVTISHLYYSICDFIRPQDMIIFQSKECFILVQWHDTSQWWVIQPRVRVSTCITCLVTRKRILKLVNQSCCSGMKLSDSSKLAA